MKIIHITGPESSGKTSLAHFLSQHLPQSLLVEEFAREWLSTRNRTDYSPEEVLEMFEGQQALWKQALLSKKDILIFDTDTVVYSIWFSYQYGIEHKHIEAAHSQWIPDTTILCAPDIPWEYDPLRSNPFDRELLFEFYERKLQSLQRSFIVARGTDERRNAQVLREILAQLS